MYILVEGSLKVKLPTKWTDERWRKPLCNSLIILLVFRAVFRAASATTVSASADGW